MDKIISPAILKTFEDCPQKYILKYLKNITMPNLDNTFQVGKKIHTLASYKLKNFDINEYEKKLNSKEKEMWKYLKNNKYFQLETKYIEYSISCKINNFWIGGRIDSIVSDGEDFYILDYKTGGLSDEMTYDYQTIVYLLCCSKYIEKYHSLNFVYIDLKNKKEVIIKLTDVLKEEYEEIITKICKKIEATTLYENKCKNRLCEYSKICNNL